MNFVSRPLPQRCTSNTPRKKKKQPFLNVRVSACVLLVSHCVKKKVELFITAMHDDEDARTMVENFFQGEVVAYHNNIYLRRALWSAHLRVHSGEQPI